MITIAVGDFRSASSMAFLLGPPSFCLPVRAGLAVQVTSSSAPGRLMVAGQPLEPTTSLAGGQSEQPRECVLGRDIVRDLDVRFVPRTDELEMSRCGEPQSLNGRDQCVSAMGKVTPGEGSSAGASATSPERPAPGTPPGGPRRACPRAGVGGLPGLIRT